MKAQSSSCGLIAGEIYSSIQGLMPIQQPGLFNLAANEDGMQPL